MRNSSRRSSCVSAFKYLVYCSLVVFISGAVSLRAQENGTIVGTVTDPSGAIIPSVTITVTNQATGAVTRTTATNSDGNYLVPGLPISTYTVRAEKAGFSTATHTDLVVNVGSDLRVDFALTVGTVSQEVSVTASAVHLQTENAQVSDTVTAKHIEAIDTNGRNFIQLANLVPGAVGPSLVGSFNTPVGVTANSGINFNGERQSHNVFSVDGQENYDRGCGGCIEVVPDQDAIAEFKVLTSNASQDLGFGSAAHIQLEIRSGTQAFHGEVFEFNRNKALETQPFFTNLAHQVRPYENYNNFGFNLGGPFGRPGKDHKTFFFTTIDWRKLLQGSTFSGNGIPANWATGDFSFAPNGIKNPVILDHSQPGTPCTDSTGKAQTCYPIISSGGVNNVIPAIANAGSTYKLDQNALLLGKSGFIFLPPNSGTQAIGGVTAPVNVNEQIVRIDHQFSDRTSLMAHYIRNGIVQVVPRGLWQSATFPVVATNFLNEPESILLKLTHSISPTLLSESVVGFNRQPLTLLDLGTFAKPAGNTIQEIFPENPQNRIPNISISGTPQGVSYTAASWPWNNVLNTWTFRETLTKISGSHTLNFGFEDLHYLKQQLLFGQTQGAYNFDGGATSGFYIGPGGVVQQTTGNSFASFMLGNPQNYSEEQTQFLPAYINNHTGLWLGDDWKVKTGFTLNLGLRWEGMPHAYERHNDSSVFVPALFNSTLAATVLNSKGQLPNFNATTNPYLNGIGLPGKTVPRGFVQNHWANFEPRVGFAWQPRPSAHKLVIRGGFGLFYENVQGNDVYNIGPNPPFSSVPQIFNNALESTNLLDNPGGGTAVALPGNLQSLQPTYPQQYSIQYNFGGEYQFSDRTVFSLSYVGNKSYSQSINENINQPLPSATAYPSPGVNAARPFLGWANINQYTNIAKANYNSLQASLRATNWHGLTTEAAYTYSHCLDFVDGDLGGIPNFYNLTNEYGHCGFDVRHTLIVNYVYALPFFNHSKGLARTALGGWQVSGVSTFYSGLPFTIGAQGGDIANCGCGGYRANLVGNPNSGSGIHTRLQWFNTAAFAADSPGSFGTEARNVMRGQGINNFDFSVYKNFAGIPLPHSAEGGTLQFRLESYNLFNHTQFNGYATGFGSGNFGQATGTRLPRQLQLGLKFSF